MSTFKAFGEYWDDFLKCIIEAFAVVVKSASLQSHGLAFPHSCCEALDKFPQITGPAHQLGRSGEPHKVGGIEGRFVRLDITF